MRADQRHGLKNNLVRWVHRHDQVATLFRSPSSSSQGLPRPRDVRAAGELRSDSSQNTVGSGSEENPAAQFVGPDTSEKRAVEPRETAGASRATAPAPTKPVESGDQDWKRLQAIFRLHQAPTDVPQAASVEREPEVERISNDSPDPPDPPAPHSGEPQRQPPVFRKEDPSTQGQPTLVPEQGEREETRSVSPPERTNFPTGTIQAPPVPSVENQAPSVIQRMWSGLGTVFRKHPEQGPEKTAVIPETSHPPDKASPPDASQPLVDKEPARRKDVSLESSQASLPVQPALAADASSSTVQRLPENREIREQMHEDSTVRQGQARLSASEGPGLVTGSKPDDMRRQSKPSEGMPVLPEQDKTETVGRPPLQSVWNVQRLEAPGALHVDPAFLPKQNIASAINYGSSEGPKPAEDQERDTEPIGVREEHQAIADIHQPQTTTDQGSSGSSPKPVEILAPSRARPARTSVAASSPAVQRQSEHKETPGLERTGSSLVSTAIGPLPSDLWSLLGQNPPANSHQPERGTPKSTALIDDTVNHSSSTTSTPLYSTSAERSTDPAPAALQRQVAPSNSSPATTAEQSPSPKAEKKSQAEPDLQDLVQKVYIEIRHRLANELERTHRYL
jgi:hypothetical protein